MHICQLASAALAALFNIHFCPCVHDMSIIPMAFEQVSAILISICCHFYDHGCNMKNVGQTVQNEYKCLSESIYDNLLHKQFF